MLGSSGRLQRKETRERDFKGPRDKIYKNNRFLGRAMVILCMKVMVSLDIFSINLMG